MSIFYLMPPLFLLTYWQIWQLSKALTTVCIQNSYPLCLLYISLIKLITGIGVFNEKRERQTLLFKNIINTGFRYIDKSAGYTQHTGLSLSICWIIAFSVYWRGHFLLIIGQSSPVNHGMLPHRFAEQAHPNMCHLSVGVGYTMERFLTSTLKFAFHPRREYSHLQRSGIR